MFPKVLIVAENASASAGGEAFIPLQYFKHFRELGVDVHLLVHERWQKELGKLLPKDTKRLHFVRDTFINIWCHKISQLMHNRRAVLFTIGAVSHFNTQLRQRRLVSSLIQVQHFDIIHEPIPVSPRLPSIMFGMPVPVVIGPMNGGMDFPPGYNLDRKFERLIIFILRSTSAFWNTILPGKLDAALLLVANKRTHNALPHNLKRKKIREMVENGVDLELFKPMPPSETRRKSAIIYVGALLDWKRVDLLIAACASLIGKLDFEVHIVGEGPERGALERRTQQLLLTKHVRIHGQLSHAAVADLVRASDILVHPAMRECGGAVILEAMASGIPVIAANWGGPSDYIDANSGVLVPPVTPDKFVGQLADAILSLSKDPVLRNELGKAGRRRVQELYDWRIKAKAMLQIYKDVLGATRDFAGRDPGRVERSCPSVSPVGMPVHAQTRAGIFQSWHRSLLTGIFLRSDADHARQSDGE
jgi:glycosyltransferase involved in cell wall biosynthesis